MGMFDWMFRGRRRGSVPERAETRAREEAGYYGQRTSEVGTRATPENTIEYLYRQMQPDYGLRAKILDLRHMDETDTRVKKIHTRMARTAVKGGLKLRTPSTNERIIRAWRDFERRLSLAKQAKLESDARGLIMEGNLPLQWVLDERQRVVSGVRMPTEGIVPRVNGAGRFLDPRSAYDQVDLLSGAVLATFPLWQLTVTRLTPDNYDDMGSLGRPYLDAARGVWRKLNMTEEDLVIRRRHRAPLRMSHVLEGATTEELDEYRARVENDQADITTDYYQNRKGGVSPIQGDANLDQIADVVHLLDTFFAGSPAPKALFGYAGELQRDILEDLKKDYFDEIDALQDTLAAAYETGFRLELLLRGVNPDNYQFSVVFSERRTETPNQRADLALKHQALGVPYEMLWDTAGLDPAEVRAQREAEDRDRDPYPSDPEEEDDVPGNRRRPRVSVTPGNGRKGESATDITTRSRQ
ncbi:hypothetical protein H0Z60_14790 [Ectothiorhodospiraceae bacterium WFHF3C12]|nr:hypothetical protein [Ectothiorhodospiraceae bacterium WFHF3C12]